MSYTHKRIRAGIVRRFTTRFINLTTALIMATVGLGGIAPLLVTATAHASSVEIVDQDFSTCTTGTSSPTPAMTNWSFSGTNCYPASGVGNSTALKLSDDGNSATLTLPLGAGQTADTLSFHLNQVAAGDNSDSSLFLDEYDGATLLGDYDVSAQSDNVLPLNPATTKLVFTIGNVGGNNLALDNVVVTANNTNTAPVATNATFTGDENTTLNGSLATNATDADGDALIFSKVTDPSHGTVIVATDGSFTYTPLSGYNGTDSFTFKANDGTADSNVATATITVTPSAPAAHNTVTLVSRTTNSITLAFDVEAGDTNGTDASGTACFDAEAGPASPALPVAQQSICLGTGTTNITFNNINDYVQVRNNLLDGTNTAWQQFDVLPSDTTGPAIDFTSPTRFNNASYNEYFAAGPNIAITASDPSGVKNTVLHVSKSDGTPMKFCPVATSDSTSCDTSSFAEGSYYVKAAATDNAGNSTYVTKHFTVDTTKPNAHISAPSDGSYNNTGDFTISGTASDSLSGIDHVSVYVAHDPWSAGGYEVNDQTASFDSTTGTFSYDASGIPDGNYVIKAVAFDQAGNSRFANSVHLTVDTTAPVATIDGTDPSGKTFNGSTNISVHVIDTNYLQTDIYRAGSTFHQVYHGPGTYFGLFWLKNGDYTMVVSDKAGNSTTYHFTIHRNDPTITFVNPARFNNVSYNQYFNNIGTIEIHATGDNRSIASTVVHIYNADGSYSSAWCGTAVAGDTASCDASGLAAGDYYVKVSATDVNGNATYIRKDFTIDKTRPDITFVNPTDFSRPFSSGPNLEIQATDANGVATTVLHVYKSDGTPALFCPVSNSDTASCDTSGLPSGDYYVKAGATDNAGNNRTITQNFTIDSIRPNAIITSPSDNSNLASDNFTITGTATDNTGIDHVNIYVTKLQSDGSFGGYVVNNQLANFDSTTGTFTYDVSGLADGNYTIKANAYDLAGNNHFASTVHITVDTTHPTVAFVSPTDFSNPFQAGPNVTVSASDTGSGLDVFVIHVYNASDDSAAKFCTATSAELTAGSMSCDLSGLADGTYYIKAGANDKAGNNTTINSGNFTIDSTAPGEINNLVHSVSGNDVTWTWDAASDSGSGVVGYLFDLTDSHGNHVTSFPTTTPDTALSKLVAGLADGTYTFSVVTVDNAGNHSAAVTDTVTLPANVSGQGGAGGSTGGTGGQTNGSSSTGGTGGAGGNAAFLPQVLGANTNTPSSQTGNNDKDSGHIKGDKTNKELVTPAKNTSDSGFNWNWLWLLLLLLLIPIYFAARKKADDK